MARAVPAPVTASIAEILSRWRDGGLAKTATCAPEYTRPQMAAYRPYRPYGHTAIHWPIQPYSHTAMTHFKL